MIIYENEIRKLCEQLLEFKQHSDLILEQIIAISDDWFNMINNLSENNQRLKYQVNNLNEAVDDIEIDIEMGE